MSTKQVRWILLAVGLLLVILAFLISDVLSGDRKFFIDWDYYPAYGDSDVVKLKVYEVRLDSTIVKCWQDSINVQWTTHQFTIQDDNQIHYFAMTAVDAAGNESVLSNFAILDLAKPTGIMNVRIR